ncbi:MAG: ADP-glyceromanno-heptose 6-epimerase [Parachlamydiales bacterium]
MKRLNLPDDKWIVVTGAAGFVGSALIRYLNDCGFTSIIAVDDLGEGEKWRNLVGKEFAELLPIAGLPDWLDGRETEIQAFLHMGAISSTVETDADRLLDINTRYTQLLATYALEHGIRFIYASSAATYGDGSQGFSDDHEKLKSLRPLNMYGYSKHLFDLWAKKEGALDTIVGLKFFNLFGPNEHHKGRMSSVIPHFVDQIEEKGEVRLFKSSDPKRYADGEQERDFLYIKDAVGMACSFLQSEAAGLYNIGSGKATTFKALAHAVFNALGKPEKIKYIPMPEDLVGKYQNHTCADMRKFSRHLPDWVATPIGDAVADYVHHLKQSQTW